MFNYKNCTGVAAIYSHGKYMSGDLDFVFGWQNNHKEIKKALKELGFHADARVFSREGCPFTMDFSSPPVDIGDKNDPEIKEEIVQDQVIRILTPTETIKDRLHKAHHWKDELALQAALEVALVQTFSLSKVKKFSEENKIGATFEEFEKQYKAMKKA